MIKISVHIGLSLSQRHLSKGYDFFNPNFRYENKEICVKCHTIDSHQSLQQNQICLDLYLSSRHCIQEVWWSDVHELQS